VIIEGKQITVEIAGLGILFHSPIFAEQIAEGADYLTSNYATEQQVQSHIQKGTIICFGTGTPGTFRLTFHSGYPDETTLENCEFKLRVGVHCLGGIICVRDLYELLDWRSDCPIDRRLQLDDGFYQVTLCSDPPPSGGQSGNFCLPAKTQ
jgi:hypothetical protein